VKCFHERNAGERERQREGKRGCGREGENV